jgi:hypothetical protein
MTPEICFNGGRIALKKYLIILLILAAACAGPLRRDAKLKDGPVQFYTVLAGSHSLSDSSYVVLIKNQDDWNDTWLIAKGKIEPLPSIPTIDFGNEYIIAAFMGQRPTSGYKIEITEIEKRGSILDVFLKKYETPGMLTVITNPYCLVRLPKGNYDLNIIEEIVE